MNNSILRCATCVRLPLTTEGKPDAKRGTSGDTCLNPCWCQQLGGRRGPREIGRLAGICVEIDNLSIGSQAGVQPDADLIAT